MIQETLGTSFISSDEETFMLRNPKVFPVVRRACMHLDFRVNDRSMSDSPQGTSKEKPEIKDKLAVARKKKEEFCDGKFQDVISSIKKKHDQKLKIFYKNKLMLKQQILKRIK
jgi:hypothetical protein